MSVVPARALDKSRFFTMLPSATVLLVTIPQVLTANLTAAHRAGGLGALLLLAGGVVMTYRMRRALPGDLLAVPVLAAVAGSGVKDPMAVMGIAYGIVLGLSLYGSLARAAALTTGVMGGVLLGLSLNPAAASAHLAWHDPTVLSAVPQTALLSALTRILYGSLVSQERISRQQAVLAESGGLLLSARNATEISQAVADTWTALDPLMPRTACLYLHREGDHLAITDALGLPAPAGDRLPVELLASLDAAVADGSPVRHGLEALPPLAAGAGHWTIAALSPPESERFLLAGGPAPVRAEDVTVFRTLGHQLTTAYANCASRDRLHHQAHHDQLTGLPTRRLFQDAVTEAIASQPAGVVLLYLDLDDFKPVNDRYGHAGGDELLIAVADRLAGAAAPDGLAARFGGDEFGILLTGMDGEAAVGERVAVIQHLLTEPVRLTAATVTVGASIGVARWQPAMTTHDLLQSADAAMYVAKSAGKNQVAGAVPEHELTA